MFSKMKSFETYNILTLLINALMASLCAVQLVAEHPTCEAQSGRDLTALFNLLFIMLAVTVFLEMVNAHLIIVYSRYKFISYLR